MKAIFILTLISSSLFFQCASNGKNTNPGEKKPNQMTAALEDTYWKLMELNGQPVVNPSGNQKEAYIQFNRADYRVVGSGGCNALSGAYEIMDGSRLRFTGVASTRMACPDMSLEDGLNRAITMTDHYAIDGLYLTLHKAKMAPLARFEAIKK